MSGKTRRRARTERQGIGQRVSGWLIRHVQVLFYTMGQLSRRPLGTLMTASVIGIALALPSGVYVLLENFRAVSRDWEGTAEISLFLRGDVDNDGAARLGRAIQTMPQVASTRLVSRVDALAEFREVSGLGDALAALEANPLPHVIIVRPQTTHTAPEDIRQLVAELKARPEVDIAQFDLQWVKRLLGIMAIVQRGVLVLAAFLSVAVLLIVGNTIRLAIQNRRAEIEIAKLFGATNAFIRRPFLYTGLGYGLLGGVIAMLVVGSSLELLKGPVGHLAELYYSDFVLTGLGAEASLVLVGTGAALGLAGSWIAVGRHLGAIEPS